MAIADPPDMPSPDSATLLDGHGCRLPIRPLTADATAGLIRFHAGLTSETRRLFWPHAYDATTLSRLVSRQTRGLDRSFLLYDDATVIGYFFLWEFDHPVPMLGLGLADAWQGRGLGARMLSHLIREAESATRTAVELTTVTTNTRAFRLYQRAGFQNLGEVENVAGDGRVVREFRMFLPLQAGAVAPDRTFQPPA